MRVKKLLGILAAIVAAVEILARITRAWHNRTAGDRLYVEVTGDGAPIVFLHGFRGSGRYWQPHVRALASEHRVIVVDLLGFGRSPWPKDAQYDVREHLDAIHRSIAPHVNGRRATIVGHSAGAILAAEYARAYPGEVSGVILLNAPMFRSPEEARERIHAMSPMAEMFSVQRFWARASCDLMCAMRPLIGRIAPHLDRSIPPHVARDAVLHRWESFDRTLRHVVLESHLEETLRALGSVPVTLLHGTKDAITERARLEATGAQLIFIEGDHNMFLRSPGDVVNVISQRVRR